MKIVFVDFDGVLNSTAYYKRRGFSVEEANQKLDELIRTLGPEARASREGMGIMLPCFDLETIPRLNQITESVGAKIVLSTAWRRHIPINVLRQLLDKLGVQAEVIGKTPKKFTSGRATEISMWMTDHLDQRGEEIENFIILEDSHHMGIFESRVIRTSLKFGLLDEHVPRAIALWDVPNVPVEDEPINPNSRIGKLLIRD